MMESSAPAKNAELFLRGRISGRLTRVSATYQELIMLVVVMVLKNRLTSGLNPALS